MKFLVRLMRYRPAAAVDSSQAAGPVLSAPTTRLSRMSDDRPLRILHLTAGSDAGGLSRYIDDLASAMIAQGHDVTVAGERGAWHWLFEKSSIPWIDAPLKGGAVGLWRSVSMLRRWLRDHPA